MTQKEIFDLVLEMAENHAEDFAAVFDLDSTLFNVAPRITKIINEFAAEEEMKKKFPEECRALESATHHPLDWGIEVTCRKAGLSSSSEDFHRSIFDYWFDRFHSNDYLVHDEPIEGAIEFVQSVHSAGARVIYLTGRDVHRYGDGTVKILEHHGFPVGENAEAALKPHKKMADAPFKHDFIAELLASHKEVWFFENEPVNINLVAQQLPEIKLVFFDGAHSGKEEPLDSIWRIKNFKHEK